MDSKNIQLVRKTTQGSAAKGSASDCGFLSGGNTAATGFY
jgi:hypothetical protein